MSNNIEYLQNEAFDDSGKLLLETGGKPVLVVVKASWCGHCKTSAPAVQQFADTYSNKVVVACIREGDGQTPSEATLMKRIRSIFSDFRGFPHFALFVDGKLIPDSPTGRSVDAFKSFIQEHTKITL
jgi:thioredoxin 1